MKFVESIFHKAKSLYSKIERFLFLYIPFISSIFYGIDIILFMNGIKDGWFIYFNTEYCGSSIFWIIAFAYRCKSMCKWYKSSLWSCICTHIINQIFYMGWLSESVFLAMLTASVSCTLILWLFFRVTYKGTKAVRSACKREGTL